MNVFEIYDSLVNFNVYEIVNLVKYMNAEVYELNVYVNFKVSAVLVPCLAIVPVGLSAGTARKMALRSVLGPLVRHDGTERHGTAR